MAVELKQVNKLSENCHTDVNGVVDTKNDENKELLDGTPEHETERQYKWYNVNTNILPAKFAYFFECARRIGYLPNMILFLSSIGLTKTEAGFIVGFRLIGHMLGGPFWGIIADKWHCHRSVIVIMSLLALVTMGSQPFLSIAYGDPMSNKCPEVSFGKPTTTFNCSLTNNCTHQNTTRNTHQAVGIKLKHEEFGKLFFMMYFINFAVSFAEGSSTGFVDTGIIRKVQLNPHRPCQYGRQRMFAAIGGAFGITLTNLAIDYFPRADVTCYSGLVFAYCVFTLIFASILLYLYYGLSFKPESPKDEKSNKKTGDMDKVQFRKILYRTIKGRDMLFFYLTALVVGLVYSQHTSFTFLYLKSMGAESYILSLSIIASNIGSIFGFYFSDRICQLLGGLWRTCVFVLVVFFIRFTCIAWANTPWLVVFAQSLHGVTTSLFVASAINYLKETSPLRIITTQVSMFNSLHYGVGTIIGSSVGGIVYEKFGGRALYMSTAVLAAIWGLVVFLFIFCVRKNNSKEAAKEEAKNLTSEV